MKNHFSEITINCQSCGCKMTVYQNIKTGDVSEIYCYDCIENPPVSPTLSFEKKEYDDNE